MKARKLSLEEFVDEIYEDSTSNTDAEYVFFLGAGCSKSSGIPLASKLAKTWHKELSKQSTKYKKFNDEYNITDATFGKFYFNIFEALFPTPLMQQKEIQRITNNEKVQPSAGYYTLATLMQKSQFNTIITTNFDNLLQDALIYRNEKRALVITHEDLAQFIKRDDTPMITKIHGDAHIHPFNNQKDTKEIPNELKTAIQTLFINTKVVFIGYGGDDKSIANLLTDCARIDQVYWCSTKEPQNVELSNWWKLSDTKVHVEERDFDRIMTAIQSKFGLKAPDFSEIANNLQANYTLSVKKENKEIEDMEDENKTSSDYFSLAYSYAEIEEHQKAINAYKEAIKINTEDYRAYNNMGVSYKKIGEYHKAIDSYRKAIEINPQYETTYSNMGVSYNEIGEYQKAIDSYRQATEINPKYDSPHNNIGVSYDKLGEHQKAIDSYRKAIELNPKYDKAYYNIGVSYDKLGEHQKAIDSYRKAIELNPKYDNAYWSIGVSYNEIGEHQKAIDSYRKAIELNPKYDSAYYSMGLSYERLGEHQKAIDSYGEAIKINPKYDNAYINLFEIQIISNVPLSEELEEQYKKLFEKDKSIFLQYEMLKIIENINNVIEINIDEWEEKYKDEELKDWSFSALEKWANTKEGKIQKKLLEAIAIFKDKVEK